MGTTRAARSALATALLLTAAPAAACGDEPRLHALDFWLGRWIVSAEREFAGHNVIEKILDGCAVTERWLSARGHVGLSLFWFDRHADRWKQVWVTDRALDVGGSKEKTEVRELTTPERIRFQGHYPGGQDRTIIEDRTTLTLDAPGRVRQRIEISTDGGKTWKTVFDGEYRPADASYGSPE
jgi:hypothetical protein